MERFNDQEYSSTLLFDLNTFFEIIKIPKYHYRPDSFYMNSRYDIEALKYLLKKTSLEYLTNYLIFAGYEFRQIQDRLTESTQVVLGRKVHEAKILRFIRNVPKEKIRIRIYNHTEDHDTRRLDIIESVQLCLEKTFETENPNDPNIFIKISDYDLNELILKDERVAFRKGAPYVVHRVAKFAELLLFFIHYNTDEICPSNPHNFTGFDSSDCRLVHDYLLFWHLIANKKIEKRNYDIRPKYIRSMITNLRKQRKKWDKEEEGF